LINCWGKHHLNANGIVAADGFQHVGPKLKKILILSDCVALNQSTRIHFKVKMVFLFLAFVWEEGGKQNLWQYLLHQRKQSYFKQVCKEVERGRKKWHWPKSVYLKEHGPAWVKSFKRHNSYRRIESSNFDSNLSGPSLLIYFKPQGKLLDFEESRPNNFSIFLSLWNFFLVKLHGREILCPVPKSKQRRTGQSTC